MKGPGEGEKGRRGEQGDEEKGGPGDEEKGQGQWTKWRAVKSVFEINRCRTR